MWCGPRFTICPFLTQVDGTEDEPITLRGRPGTDPERVILQGEDDKGRVLEIIHSYYVIEVRTTGP